MSDSLQPHGLQHTRLPCPSPSPRAYSNSCPLSQRHNPTISSSVIPFSPHLQSLPASGSLPVSSLRVSSLPQVVKVLEFQLQHQSLQWIFRTDFLYDGLVGSPCNPRDSQEPSPTPQFKTINSSVLSFLYSPTLTSIHDYWKNQTFVVKVMSRIFNTLSRLVIAFLSRSKHLLISWLQSPSAVILEPKKIVCHCFHCFPIYLPWSDGTRCHDLSYLHAELP